MKTKILLLLLLLSLSATSVLGVGAQQHTGVSHDVEIKHSRPLYSQITVLIFGQDTATELLKFKIGIENWIDNLFGDNKKEPQKWAS